MSWSWSWLSRQRWDDPRTLLGAVVLGVAVFLVTWGVSRFLTFLLRRPEWKMGQLGRKVDPTALNYLVHAKTLVVYLIGLVVFASHVSALKALVSTMAAGAGITALVVGFAARSTLSNLVAGLGIAIYRPVRIGDWVSLDEQYGEVEDITLRHTIVRTWEGQRLIIPNEKLDEKSIINHTIVDPVVLSRIEVRVSYDTDLDLALGVLEETGRQCPHLAPGRDAPWVRVIDHGAYAITLRVYLWVPDADQRWAARFWLFEHVKKAFDAHGIEIPFPYRTLVYKKDLPPPPPAAEARSAAAG